MEKAPEKKQDIFASIFGSSAAAPAAKKAAPIKPVAEIKGKTASNTRFNSLYSTFAYVILVVTVLAPLKPAAPITPPAAIKAEKKVEVKADVFASFFGNSAPKPASSKAAPAAEIKGKTSSISRCYSSLCLLT